MVAPEPDTEQLLRRAATDANARGALLERHRGRLRSMVAARVDTRLAARVDPSDLVQDTLALAGQRLDEYLRDRPIAFYPWLRQIAWERLIDLHRRHVHASRRSVSREEAGASFSDASALQLAEKLFDRAPSPSEELLGDETKARVRAALARLPERDREVLVLRHLEGLTAREAGEVLGVTEAAAKVRALRALQKLREMLRAEESEGGR